MKLPRKPAGRLRRVGFLTNGGVCVPLQVDTKGWVWASHPREVMHPYRIEAGKQCKLSRLR
jgi:hypothetical protein